MPHLCVARVALQQQTLTLRDQVQGTLCTGLRASNGTTVTGAADDAQVGTDGGDHLPGLWKHNTLRNSEWASINV